MTRPIGREDQWSRVATNSAGVSGLKRAPKPRVGFYEIKLFSDTTAATTGDRIFIFAIPEDLDGLALNNAEAFVTTASSSGPVTMWITNLTRGYEMLSVPITIEQGELDSRNATIRSEVNLNWGPAPPLMASSVALGNQIAIRVTSAGAGAMGLGALLRFTLARGQLANPNAPIASTLSAVGTPNATLTRRRTTSWGG